MNSTDHFIPDDSRPRRAAVAVIVRNRQFLIVKRAAHIRAPNQLCFPGGGIESGETVNAAVVRELQEELNVAVQPLREVWQSRSAWGVDIHWVAAELLADESIVANQDEVAEFYWMATSAIMASKNLLPSNREFFESLARDEFEV